MRVIVVPVVRAVVVERVVGDRPFVPGYVGVVRRGRHRKALWQTAGGAGF